MVDSRDSGDDGLADRPRLESGRLANTLIGLVSGHWSDVLNCPAISILVVSNHNGFRVLFDKTGLLPCILFERHIYISASEMASHRNQRHHADCSRQTFVPCETPF